MWQTCGGKTTSYTGSASALGERGCARRTTVEKDATTYVRSHALGLDEHAVCCGLRGEQGEDDGDGSDCVHCGVV